MTCPPLVGAGLIIHVTLADTIPHTIPRMIYLATYLTIKAWRSAMAEGCTLI